MNPTPAKNSKLSLPAVIMVNPKYSHNVGSAIRACSCFSVPTLLWTGHRVDPTAYERLPREERMKGYADVTWKRTDRPFDWLRWENIVPVCVELHPSSMSLTRFEHPEKAVYVFGPEDGSVHQVMRRFCHYFVHIPSHHCLNVAGAIYVTLAHRRMSRQLAGLEEELPLSEMLHEDRGPADLPTMEALGWSGH